jgi:hypothetical protein
LAPVKPTKPGWFEKIRLRRRGIDREAIKKRWHEIQITPYETLGAPRVGESADADAWARERYNKMEEPRPSEDEFMKEMQDYYVLALVPPCDGLPYYRIGLPGTSNATVFGSVSARLSRHHHR